MQSRFETSLSDVMANLRQEIGSYAK